jgi:molecular chaperone GrpE
MIYCNLTSVLNKYGVKAIDGNNKPFDPSFHQAVMTEKCDMESGMVIEVLQKGYLLKDKVIRPAMVKVSE